MEACLIRLYANAANTGALLQAVLGGAVATTQPKATVSYIDMNPATTAQVQAQRGTTYQVPLNSTTDVTIASPPGASPAGTTGQSGYVRMIDYVGIYNEDTASVTVTVKIDDAGTERILIKATLATLESLYYEDGRGWYSTDANGAEKTAISQIPMAPLFLAYNGASDTNQTGAGATVTVDFDVEVFDVTGNFAADTFTAPITGKYLFSIQVRSTAIPAGTTTLRMVLTTSNRDYTQQYTVTAGTFTEFCHVLTVEADMDAADTASVTLQYSGGAGDTAGIIGAGSPTTFFSGVRVG